METEIIKGQCENCGFTYTGEVPSPFPDIECPSCHHITNNFDSAYAVDRLNKEEGSDLEYTPSILKAVNMMSN